MKKLEVACFSPEDAKLALESGADRIEFCADYVSGGVTPDLDEFILLRSQFPEAKIHVMIRPRDGDFVYSAYKIDLMSAQIQDFESAGADGFVFGVLHSDNTVNVESCRELLSAIKNRKERKAVFHRAIDLVPNREEAFQQLIDLGFDGVLSSGGAKNAVDGSEQLTKLHNKFGKHLQIIAGGGVRVNNLDAVLATGVEWIHSAAWDMRQQKMHLEEMTRLVGTVKSMVGSK